MHLRLQRIDISLIKIISILLYFKIQDFIFLFILFVVLMAGNVFCWGFGKEGELGLGDKESRHLPSRITTKGDVIKVICGNYCTLAIKSNGSVWVWGKNKDNRLGVGTEIVDNILKPMKLKGLDNIKIIDIACGFGHCIATTNQGELYGWGKGNKNQLGPKITSTVSNPAKIELPFPVLDIACGFNCSLVISEDGDIYSWGSNVHKQLGRPIQSNEGFPCKIPNLPTMKNLSCGISYVGAITKDNQLYMWGSNKSGELGLGYSSDYCENPTIVEGLSDVLKISCGKSTTHPHTLAITNEKKVYAWGDTYKDQLGLDIDKPFISIPTEIEFFSGKDIMDVQAGGIHSMSLCENTIYTWGCGSDGRLGHPEYKGHRYLYKESIPRSISSKSKTISISCSYYHCACIAHKSNE